MTATAARPVTAGTVVPVTFRLLPPSRLHAHPGNPRVALRDVAQLAVSIRAQGVLQPLIVNHTEGGYRVSDGHRRLAAARLAQLPAVPCLVTIGMGGAGVLAVMCAAAMHQELTPLEQARAFDRLRSQGLTIAQVAASTGYSATLVRQRLLLLALPAEAQDLLDDGRLTVTAAADLAASLPTPAARRSVPLRAAKSRHLTAAHPLAGAVACGHRDTRVMVGGVGCGQCWEQAIRADERDRR